MHILGIVYYYLCPCFRKEFAIAVEEVVEEEEKKQQLTHFQVHFFI